MVSQLFLGMSLLGAEWVLYLLIILSVVSIAVIIERARFYKVVCRGLVEFREQVRSAALKNDWEEVKRISNARFNSQDTLSDLETELVHAIIEGAERKDLGALAELAQDAVVRARLKWDRNLAILATIGSNAPFIGLFGTVLGIIKAFHDLSIASSGINTVSAGISEALVATAIGLLVAIPAVIAFNLFQRKVKSALAQAEALKSFMIGRLVNQ